MPIVEENKSWVVSKVYCSDYSGNVYYNKYVIQGDTSIGRFVYKKVQVQPFCDSFVFIRETDSFDYSRKTTPYNDMFDTSINYYPYEGRYVYSYYPGNRVENLIYFWERNFVFQHVFDSYNDTNLLFRQGIGHSAAYPYIKTTQTFPGIWHMDYVPPASEPLNVWRERIGSTKNLFYNQVEFYLSFVYYSVDCVHKDDTLIYSNLGTGKTCMPFIADFTFDGQCLGDTTRINFLSCENIDSVQFDLGDGTGYKSIGLSPVISKYYQNAGDYPITMTAYKAGDSIRITKYLIVRDKPAEIHLGNDTLVCGDQLILEANTLAYKYFWSNGDTLQNTTITKSGTYFIVAGHNTCIVSDTIQVTITKKPSISLDTLYSICDGDSITISARSSQNYYMDFNWSNGSNVSSALFFTSDSGRHFVKIVNDECVDSATFSIVVKSKPPLFSSDTIKHCSSYPFILKSSDPDVKLSIGDKENLELEFQSDTFVNVEIKNTFCSISQALFIIQDLPKSAKTDSLISICVGDSVSLNITLSPGESIKWEDGDDQTPKQLKVLHSRYYSYLINNESCSISDSFFIRAIEPITPFLQKSYFKCPGQDLVIHLPVGFKYYQVDLPEIDSIIAINPGNKIILIRDSNDCVLTDTIRVDIAYFPDLIDTSICNENSIKLHVQNPYKLSDSKYYRENDSSFSFPFSGEYQIAIKDTNSCKSILWRISYERDCVSFIPNSFTPNNDGLNDFFNVSDIGNHRLIIYNRWGQILYDETGDSPSWDGRFNGVPCDDGIYYYFIQLDNRNTSHKGSLHLLR